MDLVSFLLHFVYIAGTLVGGMAIGYFYGFKKGSRQEASYVEKPEEGIK